jgi:hypothetical protein
MELFPAFYSGYSVRLCMPFMFEYYDFVIIISSQDITKQWIQTVWKLKDNSPTSTETGWASSSTYTALEMMVILLHQRHIIIYP